MSLVDELLRKCEEGYKHAVVAFVDRDGYPVSVATSYGVDPERGVVKLRTPAGDLVPTEGTRVNVIVSHIRPAPEMGYDQRRYIQFWGEVTRSNGNLELKPRRGHSWNEHEVPFFQYSEVSVRQGHEYLQRLSEEQGRPVKPRLSPLWLFLRATRLPFLSATVIPVLLGIAAAALHGEFHLGYGLLTLLAASFIHLALNVANDVFDTRSGADPANTTPTQFSGGSRVIHYGLLSMKQMAWMSAAFYAAGIGIGVYLAIQRGVWPIVTLGAIGVAISVFYTAPPFRLVHRGVGEVAVALGFGPIVLLGAYFVQAQQFSLEAAFLSAPVAILIALVLYVNEIPDRRGDAQVGKRTLPVRWSKDAVITAYVWAAALTFMLIGGGAVAGVIARPAIIALVTIPLAKKVVEGMRAHYDSPYELMGFMGTNIKLHAYTGGLLFAGYLIAIAADRILDVAPVWLT
ncbi:MAG TPA: prenyltransferase [Actinomycetota bacterium]|nr:prenyltransferase [Actinomycetota bacterium]